MSILNLGKSKEKTSARRIRRDIETESERFYNRLIERPQPDSASFMAGMQEALKQSGLQGVQAGFAALPGQFYGDDYSRNMESALLSQGNAQAMGAARMGTRGGQGRGGAGFGGSQEGVRRAQEGVAGNTQGAIAGARAGTEQARAGLATQSLQGQGQIGSMIAQMMGGANQSQFGEQGANYRAMLAAISGMGGQKMGAIGNLGQSVMGSQGGMDEQDLMAIAALLLL